MTAPHDDDTATDPVGVVDDGDLMEDDWLEPRQTSAFTKVLAGLVLVAIGFLGGVTVGRARGRCGAGRERERRSGGRWRRRRRRRRVRSSGWDVRRGKSARAAGRESLSSRPPACRSRTGRVGVRRRRVRRPDGDRVHQPVQSRRRGRGSSPSRHRVGSGGWCRHAAGAGPTAGGRRPDRRGSLERHLAGRDRSHGRRRSAWAVSVPRRRRPRARTRTTRRRDRPTAADPRTIR